MARTNATIGLGLSLLASLGAASYMSGRRAVPPLTGSVRLAKLHERVDVVRDRYGVPALFAQSEHDLFVAQGWLHASDRMFQMDLFRRLAYGELAEVVGEAALPSDRLVRVLGFRQQVESEVELLAPDTLAALTSYAAGVNAYLSASRRRLPLEFRLLGYKPAAWSPADSLAPSRLMALGLCGNWESELVRAQVAQRFGPDVLAALEDDAAARGDFPAQLGSDVLGELSAAVRDASSMFGGGTSGAGSNNWVIGPRRTRGHGALLANDPHLDLQLPSVWYENVVRCPTLQARGFTIPGVPAIVLGHNGRVGWGFTNSCADVQDLYLEEIDEEAGTYRDTDSALHELETRVERIKVKGERDQELVVRATRRGPILSDVVKAQVDQPLSIRWDAIRAGRLSDATFGMVRARGWDEFRDALRLWTAPAQNVVYADVEGNIGFQHAGEVPVRADSNGTVPLRGDDPAGEWVGTIPFEELPTSFNPASQRIVTANDRIVDDSYPHFISCEWMNGYRGDRIRQLIDEVDGHTPALQATIQADVFSIPAQQLVGAIRAVEAVPRTPGGRQVLEALQAWDFHCRVDDDGAIAWRLLQRALQDVVFGFLADLKPLFLGYSHTGVNGFWSLFGRTTARLVHDIEQDDRTLLELGRRSAAAANGPGGAGRGAGSSEGWEPVDDWSQAVSRALDLAGARYLGTEPPGMRQDPSSPPRAHSRVSFDRRGPRRRRLHRLRLQHPLGVVPGLAAVANYGPFPVPGDPDTVWQASPFNNPLNEHAMVGPSHRHVLDMADLDSSRAVLAGGQSGHPASPNYIDQVSLWRAGKMRPAPWSREAIERIAAHHQQLEPLSERQQRQAT